MRSLAVKIVVYTFGVAALIAVLEHAGGFSQILTSGSTSYATAFGALTGGAGSRTATGYGGKRG